mgnify:CR=1 FL=1
MSNITNNYAEGSCVFQSGSSQNGDITISGNIYHGVSSDGKESEPIGMASVTSPIHLSPQKGTRIDLIRLMNAWYECGKVQDAYGNRLTKREFFEWVGHMFNIDLSNYDKDLSNSMSSSVSDEKQTRIFEELKARHQAIYDSK